MSKPPYDRELSESGSSHFSGRHKFGRHGSSRSDGNSDKYPERGNTKRRSGKDASGVGPVSESLVTPFQNQTDDNYSRENSRGNESNLKSDGGANDRLQTDEHNSSRPEDRKSKAHWRKPVLAEGYGFDAKTHGKSQGRKRSASRTKRPGRNVVSQREREIIYPSRPNRHHKGLPPGEGRPAYGDSERRTHQSPHGRNRLGGERTKKSNRLDNGAGSGPLYAALDLGTNNCRLLVALPQQAGRFRVVDAFSRIVRLGEGLEGSGRLDEAAMKRAVLALGECATKLKNSNITKMRLIATEACRRAENGEKFLEMVRRSTGLDLEIVDRQTEAHLAAEGCGGLVDKKADGAVLFDIGGGSSELILLDRRGKKHRRICEQISGWTSLPVGVVTLSERHGGKNVTRAMFDNMVADVEEHLAKFDDRTKLDSFWTSGRVHLLGTSGTVTTLAGVHLKLDRYDRRQVDGIWLRDHEVDKVMAQLLDMDFQQRAANACIGAERADLVLAGCAILQALRNMWPAPRMRVADRGLREGMLTQMMNRDGAWVSPKRGKRMGGDGDKRKKYGSRQRRKRQGKERTK